jgi:hypothetical protein
MVAPVCLSLLTLCGCSSLWLHWWQLPPTQNRTTPHHHPHARCVRAGFQHTHLSTTAMWWVTRLHTAEARLHTATASASMFVCLKSTLYLCTTALACRRHAKQIATPRLRLGVAISGPLNSFPPFELTALSRGCPFHPCWSPCCCFFQPMPPAVVSVLVALAHLGLCVRSCLSVMSWLSGLVGSFKPGCLGILYVSTTCFCR